MENHYQFPSKKSFVDRLKVLDGIRKATLHQLGELARLTRGFGHGDPRRLVGFTVVKYPDFVVI